MINAGSGEFSIQLRRTVQKHLHCTGRNHGSLFWCNSATDLWAQRKTFKTALESIINHFSPRTRYLNLDLPEQTPNCLNSTPNLLNIQMVIKLHDFSTLECYCKTWVSVETPVSKCPASQTGHQGSYHYCHDWLIRYRISSQLPWQQSTLTRRVYLSVAYHTRMSDIRMIWRERILQELWEEYNIIHRYFISSKNALKKEPP